jgi:hypothetical protein
LGEVKEFGKTGAVSAEPGAVRVGEFGKERKGGMKRKKGRAYYHAR